MTLYQSLQNAKSEEDVKDAYIAALKLKKVTKGLIDIQTEEIWFEAKHKPTDVYTMFTQLLYYVCHAYNKGNHLKSLFLPPLLCVIDNEKAALMSTESITPIFKDKKIAWGKSASQVSRELIAQVSPYINDHFIVYHIAESEAEFIQAVKDSIKNGGIVRTQITPDNLKKVFDSWVEMVGRELKDLSNPADYALLFYADIMHDGKKAVIGRELDTRLVIIDEKPAFYLRGELLELASIKGYREFWNIYHRPPAEEHRNYLMERRDQLIPLDERQFKGAYYTPLKVVEKAYELLSDTLGKNWQKNYIVWDMCCGVGNLETKHGNRRNVFMSTLDQADINVMQTSGQFPAATRFQYDYLNDDIAEDGSIDYSLTGKIPSELREIIQTAKADKKKKILVLINPPYGEAASADTVSGSSKNKTGISHNKIAKTLPDLGYATRELFVQFLLRIQCELPNAVIAIFSTLKYISAPNFEPFHEIWQPKFLNGFVVHSKSFDGLKGDFPIGFLIWDLSKKGKETVFKLPAFDKKCEAFGEKKFYIETEQPSLNEWIERAKPNDMDALPLKNALSPPEKNTGDIRGRKWADNAIGGMMCKGNDFQNAGKSTALFSSGYCSAGGFLVTKDNLKKAAVVFTARRIIKPTWLNDRDQFLQPSEKLPESFYTDCLLYMLFSNSNLTAGTAKDTLEWNGKKWQLTNHFIPYTEEQVGAKNKFYSHFMSDYLENKKLSKEAKAVYNEGLKLWEAFYTADIERKIRDEYLLDNADAGWYQIRNALKKASPQTDFSKFEEAYTKLANKLEPLVYKYGFLKE
ncbi:hypothetical protein [Neisseria basseii]|uniref:hypothetical protein n=1 Tax=Neisseria basseii TaxID=2830650 RepID=UPI002658B094|nr:hypothetical protein [Neisseria basseii]